MALSEDQQAATDALEAMHEAIEAGRFIYGDATNATAHETRHDLSLMVQTMATRMTKGDVRVVRVLITYDTD